MSIYRPTTEKKFWIAPIDNTELLDEIMAEAEVIFVTPMCWNRMNELAPESIELRTYDFNSDSHRQNIWMMNIDGSGSKSYYYFQMMIIEIIT